MARRGRRAAKYPRQETDLPQHLYARLQAASTVLGKPLVELIEAALESHLEDLDDDKRELIDRVASEVLVRTERE